MPAGATELTTLQGGRICKARDFRYQIFNYYYPSTYTEVELAEKTANDVIDVEDIEVVTDLARRMYSYDLYGTQSMKNYETQRYDLMSESYGILEAIRDKVSTEWAEDPSTQGYLGWTDQEWDQLSRLRSLLENRLLLQR
ncbi:hypothetical protein F5Y09DRAFT_343302 [Xylaria sp. FL1042]|nr:hypothetical protein F5Y09DRAFT_343302 [Xylaria sp. FL1042]